MSDNLTPLSLVAAEANTTADELERVFGDHVTIDSAGIRCVPAPVAADHLRRWRQQQQVQAEATAARQAESRRRAGQISARNAAQRRGGIPAGANSSALADVLGAGRR